MPDLEVRRLGRTEMKPKALGLGGGHLGFPEQSDENAVSTIREAIERGIDFIDTSPYYGASEHRVGLALAGGWRDKVYLQTKVGSHPRFLRDFSKEATTWSLENSLRQLQTEYVDSVLIHGPRHDMEASLRACLDVLLDEEQYAHQQVERLTLEVKKLAAEERFRERVRCLRSVPGVGLLTAMTFATELIAPERFDVAS